MSNTIDEVALRQWVAEGLSDQQIAQRLEIKEYLVTQARRAAGIHRPKGRQGQERESYLLRLPDGRLEELHAAARAAGRPTSEWLARVVLEAPQLARAVREEGRHASGSEALIELLELLLGPDAAATE